jgi:hypothetical protein
MGETKNGVKTLHFDCSIKLEFKGARVVSHARSTIFQLAEVAVSEALFSKILARIHGLRYAPT